MTEKKNKINKQRQILRVLLLVTIFSFSVNSFSQIFDVDTILYSGDIDNRINFVFLSDGYTATELDSFIIDVTSVSTDLFDNTINSPFKEYKQYFNVFAIKVPSNESGASHPRTAPDCPDTASHPYKIVDNYFGSTFDYGSYYHRLLVADNATNIYAVLASNFPAYDEILILVNTPYYGGAGGEYSTISTHSSSSKIASHETGHSFAKLGDEYHANLIESPNLTQNINLNSIKWKNWIETSTPLPTPDNSSYDNEIGAFEVATGWYRPKRTCKMKVLGVPFCEVCKETLVQKIHEKTNIIDNYSPIDSSLFYDSISSYNFSVKLIKPYPSTIKSWWVYNDETISINTDSISIPFDTLKNDTNTLYIHAADTGFFVRDSTFMTSHINSIEWQLIKNGSSVRAISMKITTDIHVYPNPFSNQFTIEVETNHREQIYAVLTDITGRTISTSNSFNSNDGTSQYSFTTNNKLPEGIYFITVHSNGTVFTKKMIRANK